MIPATQYTDGEPGGHPAFIAPCPACDADCVWSPRPNSSRPIEILCENPACGTHTSNNGAAS